MKGRRLGVHSVSSEKSRHLYFFIFDKQAYVALPQLNNNRNLILQPDGVHVHFGDIVRDCLNVNFPGQWLRRGGPIA
jgi:hypothetical protein